MTDSSRNAGGQPVKQEQQQQQQPGRGKNANGRRNNRQQNHRPAYKSKVPGLENAVFSAKGTAAGYNNNVIAIADYIVGPDTGKCQYEVGMAIRTRTAQTIAEPVDPGKDASSAALKKFEILFKDWVVRSSRYEDQLKSAFPLILGQCDDDLRHRIKNRADFSSMESSGASLSLLSAIEEEGYSLHSSEYPVLNYLNAVARLQRTRMDKDGRITVGEHIENIQAAEDLIGRSGGSTTGMPSALKVLPPAYQGLCMFFIKSEHADDRHIFDSCMLRGATSRKMSSTRTIRALFSWRRAVSSLLAREPSTSTCGISSLPIASRRKRCRQSAVLPKT